jgi:hypothetical protein
MMKKFLIFLLLILLGGASVAYYYWRQITQLPEWYQSQQSPENPNINWENPAEISIAKEKIKEKIQQQINQQIEGNIHSKNSAQINHSNTSNDFEVKLNREDINQLVEASLAENSQQRQLLKSAKAIETNLDKNQVEIGAVVNPSEIPQTSLSTKERAILDKVLQTFPQFKDREIYLAIAGKPQVENGKLILDRDSIIKVGNLKFTLEEIAQRFGLPPDKVKQHLQLNLNHLNLKDIKINDREVILKMRG